MIIYRFRRFVTCFLGLYLAVLAFGSCTYDYFKDETNFLLYVPQIKNEASIENFYVAIHAEDGTHIITREITAPFDKDDKMSEGILRFKLPPGKNYNVSCFADYTPGSITIGDHRAETFKTKELDESEDNIYADNGNVYQSRSNNPLSLFTTATVYPVGHLASQKPLEVNLDKTRHFKGNVILSFIDLPEEISRIDTYYSGLATAYHIDGTFRTFTDTDLIRGSYITSDHFEGNTITLNDMLSPSAGTSFGSVENTGEVSADGTRGGVMAPAPRPLELEIRLYDAAGNSYGAIYFNQADFEYMADEKKPRDKDGNPVTSLELRSQETIKFTFKDFTVLSIELSGWGDIIPGTVTPM